MTDFSIQNLLRRTPEIRRLAGRGWRGVKRVVEGRERSQAVQGMHELLDSASPTERRMLTRLYDNTRALPSGAEGYLSEHSPRLHQLRDAYARSGLPVTIPSLWNDEHLQGADLRYFRGESPYVWNY